MWNPNTNWWQRLVCTTAFWCGYDLFLSNDGGSKEIAENQLAKHKTGIFNVMDVFFIIEINGTNKITPKEFASLAKGDLEENQKSKESLLFGKNIRQGL